MVELISKNLTGLGGRMGTERTWTNWRRFYKNIKIAKEAAEKDYGKKIEWDKKKGPTCNGKPIDLACSGDLRYVMYHIRAVKCED